MQKMPLCTTTLDNNPLMSVFKCFREHMSGLKIVLWWGSWLVLRVNTDFVHSSSSHSSPFFVFFKGGLWISKVWSLKLFDVYLWGNCVFTHLRGHQSCCPHTPLSSSCGPPRNSDPKDRDEFYFRRISFTVILHPKHFVSKGLGLETFSCFSVELTQ